MIVLHIPNKRLQTVPLTAPCLFLYLFVHLIDFASVRRCYCTCMMRCLAKFDRTCICGNFSSHHCIVENFEISTYIHHMQYGSDQEPETGPCVFGALKATVIQFRCLPIELIEILCPYQQLSTLASTLEPSENILPRLKWAPATRGSGQHIFW